MIIGIGDINLSITTNGQIVQKMMIGIFEDEGSLIFFLTQVQSLVE